MSETPVSPMGVLVIDKPIGLTSMDVCRRVRWRLVRGGAPKRVKVGHGGTLDPLATGVLVVLVGKATKLCDEVMAGRKRYETTIDLSAFSSTDDLEGEKTSVSRARGEPRVEEIVQACAGLTGEIMQKPPAFSAIKIDGQRAYDMARRGEAVEMAARPVMVHSIELVSYEWPKVTLAIECGKGTYIRSIARDLGLALSTGGHLTALRRTMVGRWDLSQARTIESLPEQMNQTHLRTPTD